MFRLHNNINSGYTTSVDSKLHSLYDSVARQLGQFEATQFVRFVVTLNRLIIQRCVTSFQRYLVKECLGVECEPELTRRTLI